MERGSNGKTRINADEKISLNPRFIRVIRVQLEQAAENR